MTALAKNRMAKKEVFTYKQFTLTSGKIAYKNALCCLDLSNGQVVPGYQSATLLAIGVFDEYVDASSAAASVNVNLLREVSAWWFANVNAATTDVGNLCYVKDDQTVTMTSTTASIAGRLWDVDATLGALVEIAPWPTGARGATGQTGATGATGQTGATGKTGGT